MRKLHAIFHRLIVLAACVMLSACFDIHEEVWIERDGAGRAELRYTVPESAVTLAGGTAGLEKKIRDLIARQPMLRLDAVSITVKDDRATVAVNVSTDSVLSLRDLKKSGSLDSLPKATANIAGKFEVTRRQLDIDFSRRVQVKEALGLASLAIGGDERQNRKLTYIVHLPTAAKDHNATLASDNGKTLMWDYTLGEAMKQPIVTRFRAPIPIPAYAWVVVGTVVAGIAGLAIHWWRKLRLR